jgi:hypothetical protein
LKIQQLEDEIKEAKQKYEEMESLLENNKTNFETQLQEIKLKVFRFSSLLQCEGNFFKN